MQNISNANNSQLETLTTAPPIASSSSVPSCNITPPNSAGLRHQASSTAAAAAGISSWANESRDGHIPIDKSLSDSSKLNRKESYKAQRKNYRREKKRVASELMNSLQDPLVIVLADWLKVRGTLKSWTKLWCILKPGLLLIYKSPKTKSGNWVGTVMLNSCQVIERPSKKDGFCFKLFHPLEQSIWAPRGPDKETLGAVTQPLPTSYLIFRAPSQSAGKCWMDALELSLRCSSLILRSSSANPMQLASSSADATQSLGAEARWSEADYEKHFNEHDLDGDSPNEGANATMSCVESDTESEAPAEPEDEPVEDPTETPYVPLTEEELGEQGAQVEELGEENKSLIWCLVRQVRPGMDLSKVVLPTFILEPRSFLDKLSDSYFHANILSAAVTEDDPFTRMKLILRWYVSGFYKKPKGLKKPYNPILGETFRCYWQHSNGSRTYYIAEQVSHHPPISAFYVTNRQDGFAICCSILAKSKFYGNSTSAVLEGAATLTLLPRGETYTLTTPYAHCKGILMGTLSMELGGKVAIECENTGYKTELEFKLKSFLSGSENINVVSGKIKLGKETMATVTGHWDREIRIHDAKDGDDNVLFVVNRETKQQRLVRYVVPLDSQLPNESERLWQRVSAAIRNDDQVGATTEKTVLEEAQRNASREREAKMIEWLPAHFESDKLTNQWIYKYADLRPWDPRNDVRQYESDYKVLTKTRHQASPMIRVPSIIAGESKRLLRSDKQRQSAKVGGTNPKNKSILELSRELNSDSSQSAEDSLKNATSKRTLRQLLLSLDQMHTLLDKHTQILNEINTRLERTQYAPSIGYATPPLTLSRQSNASLIFQNPIVNSVIYIIFGLIFCIIVRWLFKYD